jgi:hypothetical protein
VSLRLDSVLLTLALLLLYIQDLLLWEGHKQLGKRWVEISTKFFNSSRSENHIKNRWYSASFKKFIANEFGPNAHSGGGKGSGKKGRKSSVPKPTNTAAV